MLRSISINLPAQLLGLIDELARGNWRDRTGEMTRAIHRHLVYPEAIAEPYHAGWRVDLAPLEPELARLSFDLPEDLIDALDELAVNSGRDRTAEIIRALVRHLQYPEGPGGVPPLGPIDAEVLPPRPRRGRKASPQTHTTEAERQRKDRRNERDRAKRAANPGKRGRPPKAPKEASGSKRPVGRPRKNQPGEGGQE